MRRLNELCARYSAEAYQAEPDIECRETDTQAIIRDCSEREVRIIAFRGSSSGKDFRQDLKRIQADHGDSDIHRGFLACYKSVGAAVDHAIATAPEGYGIVFTGHSLGGALAQIASTETTNPVKCITFGAPRVGDSDFVTQLELNCKYLKLHENHLDPVPKVPLFGYSKPAGTHIHRFWGGQWRPPFFHSIEVYRKNLG